jgi:hypothetical protein
VKEWAKIDEKAFLSKKKKYVVCVDTLGQDRELTEDQRRFVLKTIAQFKQIWEEKERENLRRDRDRRIAQLEKERELGDNGEPAKLQEEEEGYVED